MNRRAEISMEVIIISAVTLLVLVIGTILISREFTTSVPQQSLPAQQGNHTMSWTVNATTPVAEVRQDDNGTWHCTMNNNSFFNGCIYAKQDNTTLPAPYNLTRFINCTTIPCPCATNTTTPCMALCYWCDQ